ncbi:MAG TPA: hypothetical protein VGC66_07050 [Pyrinomonadaceae bacterium]|jgi:hypothetical protein
MKRCPTCNRTFEDTFTFCLIDGSILSAPFDPDASKHQPASRSDNAPPTEVLPPVSPSSPVSFARTIVSPEKTDIASANASDSKENESADIDEDTDSPKGSGLPFIVLGLVVLGILFIILGGASKQEGMTGIGIFLVVGGVIILLLTAIVKSYPGSSK